MFKIEDSSTYWWISNRGWIMGYVRSRTGGATENLAECPAEDRAEITREVVLKLGEEKFHTAATATQAALINALTDLDRSDRLIDRIPFRAGWDDLLAIS